MNLTKNLRGYTDIVNIFSSVESSYYKSCDTTVAAYCGLINNVMNLILPDMCSFSQPFEDLNKRK